MSHTTSISSIKIMSIPALRSAVKELQDKGIACSLVENAKPRAYYSTQEGLGVAPFVLRLDNSKYDVGFYPSADGGYEARTDFWNGEVNKVLGATASKPENRAQAQMGKLYQMYSLHVTMDEAKKKGMPFRRMTKADGSEQIVITVNN